MKLKIHPDTSAAIEQALRDVNGCSQAHTFTEFSEISLLAETAEMELTRLDLPAVHRKSVKAVAVSPDGLSVYAVNADRNTLTVSNADGHAQARHAPDHRPAGPSSAACTHRHDGRDQCLAGAQG